MVTTEDVYLSLGSNLGDRMHHLQEAIKSLQMHAGELIAYSSVYETLPVGFVSKDKFLNMCVKMRCASNPQELLRICQHIEYANGRIRNNLDGYQSRTLDIDILIFGKLTICSEDLVVPHPRMLHRNFVLLPLLEIEPEIIYPGMKEPLQNMLESFTSDDSVKIFAKKVNFNISSQKNFSG